MKIPDRLFSDAELAALYDIFYPPEKRDDFAFYQPLMMAARSVLDVGCGTGALLHQVREAGHRGRLCGLDPAAGMIAQARRRNDIEWVPGDLASVAWVREFDLAIMTGHAFQVLLTDQDIRTALAAVYRSLMPAGCFAFETRNPSARAWERWSGRVAEIADNAGAIVRMTTEVVTPFDGNVVSFTHTFTSPGWREPQVSFSTLRFLDADALDTFLGEAGFTIDAQYGNWDRSISSKQSPEIITVARRG